MAAHERGRLGIAHPDRWIVGGVLLAFFALRMLALRTTPIVYFDSGDYRHLELWGGRRPFTVPLLFWLMPSDKWRIVEQAVISAGAWIAIALVVGATLNDRRVRLGTMAALLALGTTTQITNWDTTILSDSIAISLTVLLVAAWLAAYRAPSKWSVAALLATTLLWTFTRELHVYVSTIVAFVVVVSLAVQFVRTRTDAERRVNALWGIVAGGLVVIAALGIVESRSNEDTSKQNLAGVIGARILPVHEARQWFVDAGMPEMPHLVEGKSHPDKELLAVPEFDRWATNGWAVYARYLLTHPRFAIDGPYRELLEERPAYGDPRSGREVLLSPADAYGRARPVLPSAVEDLLFGAGRSGALVLLGAAALVSLVVVNARTGRDRRRHVPLVVAVAALVYIGLAWHGSVFEPGRHAMPAAVAVRLGLLTLLAVVVDRFVTEGAR
jgi:hypothetical protein